MLEPLVKPQNLKFKVSEGLVFVEYAEPDGNLVGELVSDEFPSPVLVVRDPQRAYYSFRSDWFLPNPVEPPARYTTFGKCMNAAGATLSPTALEGFKIKKRPEPKPKEEPEPRILRDEFIYDRDGISIVEQKWSDGRLLWVFVAPHLFEGELHLCQFSKHNTISQITKLPKGMLLGDHWSSPHRLRKHLESL